MKVLVVEDEKKLNTMIRDYLVTLEFQVVSAFNGREALELFGRQKPGFVVLDLMLPVIDGLEVLRKIRAASDVPVLILTARSSEAEKLMGLELGADDYMVKPFSIKELAARIRTILRRTQKESKHGISSADSGKFFHADLVLDSEKRTVLKDGQKIRVTALQFEILKIFFGYPGRVFRRAELLEMIQSEYFEGYERTIDVHIKNIRKLLGASPGGKPYIQTVWGIGYKLPEEDEIV